MRVQLSGQITELYNLQDFVIALQEAIKTIKDVFREPLLHLKEIRHRESDLNSPLSDNPQLPVHPLYSSDELQQRLGVDSFAQFEFKFVDDATGGIAFRTDVEAYVVRKTQFMHSTYYIYSLRINRGEPHFYDLPRDTKTT